MRLAAYYPRRGHPPGGGRWRVCDFFLFLFLDYPLPTGRQIERRETEKDISISEQEEKVEREGKRGIYEKHSRISVSFPYSCEPVSTCLISIILPRCRCASFFSSSHSSFTRPCCPSLLFLVFVPFYPDITSSLLSCYTSRSTPHPYYPLSPFPNQTRRSREKKKIPS